MKKRSWNSTKIISNNSISFAKSRNHKKTTNLLVIQKRHSRTKLRNKSSKMKNTTSLKCKAMKGKLTIYSKWMKLQGKICAKINKILRNLVLLTPKNYKKSYKKLPNRRIIRISIRRGRIIIKMSFKIGLLVKKSIKTENDQNLWNILYLLMICFQN